MECRRRVALPNTVMQAHYVSHLLSVIYGDDRLMECSHPFCAYALLICIGVYCRDGNNATIDPFVCLSNFMDKYHELETHRECHVPCQTLRDGDSNIAASMQLCRHQHSTEARSLCPRNCIGTRSIPGMSPHLTHVYVNYNRNCVSHDQRVKGMSVLKNNCTA